jgi:hypothetical protein
VKHLMASMLDYLCILMHKIKMVLVWILVDHL